MISFVSGLHTNCHVHLCYDTSYFPSLLCRYNIPLYNWTKLDVIFGEKVKRVREPAEKRSALCLSLLCLLCLFRLNMLNCFISGIVNEYSWTPPTLLLIQL